MHSFHSCLNIWQFETFYKVPLEFTFTIIRMWYIFGFTTIYILLGITTIVYTNKIIQNYVDDEDEDIELNKKREDLGRIMNESFDNIRVIKQYGWDSFFRGKMTKLHAEIRKTEEEKKVYGYLNWIMTAVLPQLITPMTFIISIAMGNVLNFGDSVELLALIGRARHPIERVVGI